MSYNLKYTTVLASLFISNMAIAQDATPTAVPASNIITGEGIGNDMDRDRRNPTVSVNATAGETSSKILVDAYIADPEFKEYPIQFDFYINRQFFTSQLRSAELPGPVGIEVPNTLAATPFNYSVVAKTLHPNRVFTTIINGAVFSSNLNTTFDCTLTTGVNSEDSIEYISNNTAISQSGNDAVSLSIDTDSTPSGHEVIATSTLTISGTEASGSIVIEEDGGEAKTVEVTGTAEKTDGKLSSISVSSADSDTSLSCS